MLPGRPRSFRAIADAGSGLTRDTPANSGSEGDPNNALVPALPSKPAFAAGSQVFIGCATWCASASAQTRPSQTFLRTIGGSAMNANTFGNSGSEIPFAVAVGHSAPTGRVGASPGNRILAALPPDALSSLLAYLKPEFLPRGRVLCDIDESLRHVYFVERGLVSMVAVFADRTTVEMATVGREGLVWAASTPSPDTSYRFPSWPWRSRPRDSGMSSGTARNSTRRVTLTPKRFSVRRCRPRHATASTWSRSGVRAGF